jgi:Mrp family chromosome partitioning ATPase/capsular polysaccharide biosynthesis protein
MDLLSYFRVLRRRWALIVLCVAMGGAIGAATTLLQTKSTTHPRAYYRATHTLLLGSGQSSSSPLQPSISNLDQVGFLVTSGDVPDRVANDVTDGLSAEQLADRIVTEANPVTGTIDIVAAGTTPQEAEQIADAFAKEVIASIAARDQSRYNDMNSQLNDQLTRLKTQANGLLAQIGATPKTSPDYDTLQKQYDATQNQYYSVYGELQQLDLAGPPSSPLSSVGNAQATKITAAEYQTRLVLARTGQNHLRADATTSPLAATPETKSSVFDSTPSRVALGLFLGLLVGLGLAMVLDRLDHRIRFRADCEETFGLPVLAEVPRFSRGQARHAELLSHTQPLSRAAEAYRAIRTSLLFQQASVSGDRFDANPVDPLLEPTKHGCFVVMVTSASPREGKTTTSANLAVVFAEAGESVLVVNCDFRRPSIHTMFGVPDEPRHVQPSDIPGIHIVTNVVNDPAPNPARAIAEQRAVVNAARDRFDVVILDTAPMLTANDAIEVVGVADLVLLVARLGSARTDSAERMMQLLGRLDVPLAGVVLVGTESAANDYYYYYQPGRVDGADAQASTRPPARAAASGTKTAANGSSNGNGNGNGNGASVSGELFGEAGQTPG